MRFATAIIDFSEEKGGAERYLVNLCTRMVREGHEVHVYAERGDEKSEGIHFHRIHSIPFPKSLRLLSFAIRASRRMEEENYDVTLGVGNTLQADVYQPHGGVHWAWFWRSLRVYDHPLLWLIKFLGRVFSPKQWASGWIEGGPCRQRGLPKIVAISDMVKKDLIRWYRVPEGRIELVYNGVDIERFHPRNRSYSSEIRRQHGIGDELVILFVSNNFRMKGLGYLIRALGEIKKEDHPPLRLLILGRDKQAPYLSLLDRLGLSEEVIFAGSTGQPEKYYGATDLLAHPAFYDAFSLTVLEALASGLPVITTSSTGASGLLSQGEDGWVIGDPRDGKSLKEAIQHFFNPKVRQEASRKARKKAEMNSEEINYRRMMTIFSEVGGN